MIRRGSLVVDASMALSILLKEPDAEDAALVMANWTSGNAPLLVPAHFWLEVANTLLKGQKWNGDRVLQAIRELDEMQLETFELDRGLVVLAVDLAERHGLTAYDAGYLALAVSMDASLATFDAALRSAAGGRAVRIGRGSLSETQAPYEHVVTWPNYKGASAFLAKLRAEAAARPG